MRRLSGALLSLALLSGCAGAALEPSPIPTTAPARSTSSTTSTTLAPTTSVPTGPPVGWIAPSGVPVAVTAATGDVVEVLTPCGNPETLVEGTPIYEVDVLIDPGHGGPIDTGAVGANGLAEKDINLQVALAVHDRLTERGVASMLTRTGDYPIPIRTRTAYSDLVGAEAVVSIHHNAPAAPASEIPGVEIFVQHDTTESARLGGLLYDETMAALSGFDVDWDRAPDAGVMTVVNSEGSDAYGMVRLPEAPSALIELGYIANPAEAELYTSPAYVPAAAGAIADAILSFLTSQEEGAPLVEGRNFNPQAGVGRDQCVEPSLHASLYPDVVEAEVYGEGGSYGFSVTLSSPYDSADRYADAWRVIGDDGMVYGVREMLHDHAGEQPFTRRLEGLEIPESVETVIIQGRDQVYGWGGATIEVTLP